MSTSSNIPDWKVSGDFFDVCRCNMPCPCAFAQTPSYGDCDGVLAYHIKNGHYGEASLDGLNVLGLIHFKGNIWAGETKANIGLYFDEKAIHNKERLYKWFLAERQEDSCPNLQSS